MPSKVLKPVHKLQYIPVENGYKTECLCGSPRGAKVTENKDVTCKNCLKELRRLN